MEYVFIYGWFTLSLIVGFLKLLTVNDKGKEVTFCTVTFKVLLIASKIHIAVKLSYDEQLKPPLYIIN